MYLFSQLENEQINPVAAFTHKHQASKVPFLDPETLDFQIRSDKTRNMKREREKKKLRRTDDEGRASERGRND